MAVIDVKQLVMGNILAHYPTDEVDRNLDIDANLAEDLNLSSIDVYHLGLIIEKDLQYLSLPSLTDDQIMGWKTVSDIVESILQMPGVENREDPL